MKTLSGRYSHTPPNWQSTQCLETPPLPPPPAATSASPNSQIMAAPDSSPPAYADSAPTAQPGPAQEPPTYGNVADSLPRDQLVAGELPCLILDDCLIYSAS